ncbi:Holliday junction resolvase RuvX [Cupriavidus sp. AU9028]|uniref:Holliday junction resolvase RuvX n=1 Tax=Cupriavidus sp. AU9028 TaxID=2871157 RepID=UPI001C9752CC|nr:Holliday junction resolvase RuvX [Cupriavidus sp. AU9028]MBY4898102.1 Holliday junction resolvase RuvX [Cupriavidus sp. AU9028]
MPDPGAASPREQGPATAAPTDGTVLAFDYGERKIGVALGNFVTRQARPLTILPNVTVDGRFRDVGALIAEWAPVHLVVGLPLDKEGGEQPVTRLARRFSNQLNGRFGLPVTLVDERYSSRLAQMAGGKPGQLDDEAARIILQQFFDQLPL